MLPWMRAILALPEEPQRALLAWPPLARPIEAYRADASERTPVLELCRHRCEERRAWRALVDANVRVRPHEAVQELGIDARFAGAALRAVPALFEPSADVARAGFALWSELPWRMVLIATVQR
jgi:hypothetical protein